MRQCELALNSFMVLAESIGIPIKQEKTVLLNTCFQLHSLEVCTQNMEIRLPHDKTRKALLLIEQLGKGRTVTLKQLESIICTLNFTTKAVIPGHTFLRRLIDLTKGMTNKSYINLTKQSKLDIQAWNQFLLHFNGKTLICK